MTAPAVLRELAALPADTDIALGSLRPDQHGVYTVAGRRIPIPVRVAEARMAAATFVVPHEVAAAVIEGTGLTPARQRGGKAVVALALVRYVDCDLGDYDELGLCFVVEQPTGQPRLPRGAVATYIHRLPVSQAFTCEAGRGIWGFPKWVADLRVMVGRNVATATLRDAERATAADIFLRTGGIPLPSKALTMVCYSNDDEGRILRTSWETTNVSTRVRMGLGVATVNPGAEGATDDPFAADLRALGFPRRALMVTSATMRATFGAPEPL